MREGKLSESRPGEECRVAHARGVTAGRGPEPGATGVGGAGDVTGPRVRAVLGSWGSRDPSLSPGPGQLSQRPSSPRPRCKS